MVSCSCIMMTTLSCEQQFKVVVLHLYRKCGFKAHFVIDLLAIMWKYFKRYKFFRNSFFIQNIILHLIWIFYFTTAIKPRRCFFRSSELDRKILPEMVEKYLKEGKMFDTILMDLYMPEMDGYEASK